LYFFILPFAQPTQRNKKMKKLLMLTNVIGAAAMVWGLGACATTNTTAVNTSQKETMLAQAGFISKTVTTPKQKQQVEKLTVGAVSAVKYKGKLLYVYPTTTKDQVYVGKQAHYDAYKKALAAQAAKAQTSAPPNSRTSADNGAYLTGETAGPNHIIVQEFDGFGPIQDNPAWQ
jgi:hypothetical protein